MAVTACPHLPGYDPLSPEQLRDPYPMWAAARASVPVFYDERLGLWSVTRLDDVLAVLRDPRTFSSADAFALRHPPLPAELERRIPPGFFRPRMLVAKDPPEHTKLRKLMQRAFTPRRVAELEPFIERTCHDLIDAFPAEGEFDLMASYANPVPLTVITRVLGFDLSERAMLRQWTEDFLVMATPARPAAGAVDVDVDAVADIDGADAARIDRMLDTLERVLALIDARRREPRDDVISVLVVATGRVDGPVLDDHDLATLALELALAGNDTTANLIAHLTGFLMEGRERWEAVRRDRALVPAAVEEALRHRGSSKGLFRRATRDVELGGAHIRAGEIVHVLFASANHDEEHFRDPRRFDPARENLADHVAFGRWTHFCLGAPLARLEARVAVSVLVDRCPTLRAVRKGEAHYAPTLTTQTLLNFPVSHE